MPEPLYVGETKKGRTISDPAFESINSINVDQSAGR
jgi:hypothetical protein